MKLAVASLLALSATAQAQIVWREPVDNRPFLVRLLTSVAPNFQTASGNVQAKISRHNSELSGGDASPGRLSWMPETWAFMFIFQADFYSFTEQ